MLVGKGIDKGLFGLGTGTATYDVAQDITGTGDVSAQTINFVKANPGDPDYIVYAYGQKYLASRKITIGPGVTISGRGDPGGGIIVGAPGYSLGSGAAGGAGNPGDGVGAAGGNSTPARGGNGGSGGGSGTRAGGSAGQALVNAFLNGWREVSVLMSGQVVNAGTVKLVNGGGGGGGGGGHAGGGAGGDGGGGAGVIIMAAPVIEIAGIMDFRGWQGNPGSGTAAGGGGGGGGGGLVILIYGELIFTGSILLTGGAGGAGFSGGVGGTGAQGGRSWRYNGDPADFVETVGAAGANG